MESVEAPEEKKSSLSAAQRRAELRRRKLLMNSEDRMNRIVGNVKSESDSNGTLTSTSRPPHSVLHRLVSLRRPRSLDQCFGPRILNDMAMCTNSDTISLFYFFFGKRRWNCLTLVSSWALGGRSLRCLRRDGQQITGPMGNRVNSASC